MMLAEKLAAKKLQTRSKISDIGQTMSHDGDGSNDDDDDEEYDLSSSDSENSEIEMGLKKSPTKRKKMTSDEKIEEGSSLNGRVVALELLSSSLVCLKHALEEINENDIDSPVPCSGVASRTLTCSK